MSDGWDASAGAWIDEQGEAGDFGRAFVLDRPMQARVLAAAPRRVLDVGCGEGRFCRWLSAQGIATVGIDPTEGLLARARALDPGGTYRAGRAEALDFDDDAFDMAVSYLTLIDIPDHAKAIAEMARVVRPGGRILVANLQGYHTCGDGRADWRDDGAGRVLLDRYLEERAQWAQWRGIRIRNWHRPLSGYMRAFLEQGLQLTHFDEPAPHGGAEAKRQRYMNAPFFHIMEWLRPASA
ncbi:MAG: SAM-dependent methyltransferase [Rhodobacteraceae bacterium]|nr:SAM-dependent methyltransferase [Paracoccaceae bacterium]MAY46865.1 SAM-dependent methyltransferase [Paracoccaceae bacterium]